MERNEESRDRPILIWTTEYQGTKSMGGMGEGCLTNDAALAGNNLKM